MSGPVRRVLFVPVSGPTGIGEVARCRMLADALGCREPGIERRFVLSRRSPAAAEATERDLLVERSPTYHSAEVSRFIAEWKPSVVVFDGAARVAQLRAARRSGAATVFIAPRPTSRRKAMRWRALRHLDALVLLDAALRPPGVFERAKLALTGAPSVVSVPVVALPRGAGRTDPCPALFVPGGGGWTVDGQPAGRVFAEAARRLAAATAVRPLVVLGPLYEGEFPDAPEVDVVHELAPRALADVMGEAGAVVTGGGSVLLQALSYGRACVATPLGGSDQDERVRRLAAAGVVVAAEPSVDSLFEATLALLTDDTRRSRVAAAAAELGWTGGRDRVVEAILDARLAQNWK